MNFLNVRLGRNLPPAWLEASASGIFAPINDALPCALVRSEGDSKDNGIIYYTNKIIILQYVSVSIF
jgi:hypothetical protein